jgi:dTDP-glucose 4,6-dehydratase
VEDHCEAIWLILEKGKAGETYNIGGECEKKNIEVVKTICEVLEEAYPLENNKEIQNSKLKIQHYHDLISYVADRPGHDRRYAINCDKIKNELGWKQRHDFGSGLRDTINWYLGNSNWVNSIRSGEYQKWIEKNYTART